MLIPRIMEETDTWYTSFTRNKMERYRQNRKEGLFTILLYYADGEKQEINGTALMIKNKVYEKAMECKSISKSSQVISMYKSEGKSRRGI